MTPKFIEMVSAKMINEILHVGSRCGGGKSINTIEQLHIHLKKTQPSEETVVFASVTNDLTRQNHEEFEVVSSGSSSTGIASIRIDSLENQGKVVKEFSEALSTGYQGVIFISHMTLSLVDAGLLQGIRLIVDEIPKDLVNLLSIRREAKDHGDKWEGYLNTQASPHAGYKSVIIDPSADKNEILRLIDNIRSEKDNTKTRKVAELLEFLLADYEVMYTTITNSKNRTYRLYQAVHWQKLYQITRNVDSFAILSAQLKSSLFGFIAQSFLGLTITDADITPGFTLEAKHEKKVRIIPFLKEGTWSTTLKSKPANEVLHHEDDAVTSTSSVITYAQEFADNLMGNRNFLVTLNKKDPLIHGLKRDGVVRTRIAMHGMNNFRNYDHAVYLASNRPSPFEIKPLQMFASDHGLSREDIVEAVVTERCHETAYQCIARTSIRETSNKPNRVHVLIVPDMGHANYIASWFDSGYATIDTQFSYSTQLSKEQDTAANKRKIIVTQILMERLLGQEKLNSLVKNAGISMSTFKRYKEEFRDELEKDGLLQPKRQAA